MRGNRSGGAVDFEQCSVEGTARGAIGTQQCAIDIEKNESAHFQIMLKRWLLAVPLGLVGAAWFFYLSLPWPVLLRFRNPAETSFMELRSAQARDSDDALRIRQ